MRNWATQRQLMNEPIWPGSGVQRGWSTQARTSIGWIENTLEYYAELNPIRKKFGTGVLCTLRLKVFMEIIQSCLTSKGYKAFRPTNSRILYDTTILRGGKIMEKLLLKLPGCSITGEVIRLAQNRQELRNIVPNISIDIARRLGKVVLNGRFLLKICPPNGTCNR